MTTTVQNNAQLTVKSGKNQRKLINLLIKPRAQIELVVNIVVLTLFFGATVSVVMYHQLGVIFDALFGAGFLDEKMTEILTQDWNIAVSWLTALIIVYLITLTCICLIHTHRMIGPNVAFQRQLRSLISGNYAVRVKLREGDYYQEVADLFNEFSEQLATKNQTPPQNPQEP